MTTVKTREVQVVDSGGFKQWPKLLIINDFICTPIRVQRIAGVYLFNTLFGLFALRRDEVGWHVEEIEGLQALLRRG